ncbi:excalibur calcium-binding domain-containing protein [Stenotrophomonas rhizophila]
MGISILKRSSLIELSSEILVESTCRGSSSGTRKTGNYHCHGGDSAAPSNALVPRSGLTSTASGRAGAFANCAEARAAGAAPVRRGDPGYGPHLDRDNDGVGCAP